MNAIDHRQLGDAVGRSDRCGITDGSSPIVRNQHVRPTWREMIAQRQDVADQVLHPVGLNALGLGGTEVAALIGRNGLKRPGEGGQHLVPGA